MDETEQLDPHEMLREAFRQLAVLADRVEDLELQLFGNTTGDPAYKIRYCDERETD